MIKIQVLKHLPEGEDKTGGSKDDRIGETVGGAMKIIRVIKRKRSEELTKSNTSTGLKSAAPMKS